MKKIVFIFCLTVFGFSQYRSINWATVNVTVKAPVTLTAPYQYSGFWFETDSDVSISLKGGTYLFKANEKIDFWPLNFKKNDVVFFPTQNVSVDIRAIWYENNI